MLSSTHQTWLERELNAFLQREFRYRPLFQSETIMHTLGVGAKNVMNMTKILDLDRSDLVDVVFVKDRGRLKESVEDAEVDAFVHIVKSQLVLVMMALCMLPDLVEVVSPHLKEGVDFAASNRHAIYVTKRVVDEFIGFEAPVRIESALTDLLGESFDVYFDFSHALITASSYKLEAVHLSTQVTKKLITLTAVFNGGLSSCGHVYIRLCPTTFRVVGKVNSTLFGPSQQTDLGQATTMLVNLIKHTLLLYKEKTQNGRLDVRVWNDENSVLSDPVQTRKQRRSIKRLSIFKLEALDLKESKRSLSANPSSKGYALTERLTVRGHFRWQPFGEGSRVDPAKRQYKLIFIEPFQKGPEDGLQKVTMHKLEV